MGFRCGIVGLPNVGKSTLFNALTGAAVAAENYPFCTIDPHVGVVPVPDRRLERVAEIVRPKEVIPTTIQFVDIAGLVAGASKGEGLGNQFLAHIRETDAIAHVVRCFDDPDVVHVPGEVDPVRDVEVVQTELILADLETVKRSLNRAEKQSKAGEKEAGRQAALLREVHDRLGSGVAARALGLDPDQRKALGDLHLLTLKPVLYIANVDEGGVNGSPRVEALQSLATGEASAAVPVCAAVEAEIAQLEPEERGEFLADLGLEESGLDRVIRAGYRVLGLHTFFTTRSGVVQAWTAPVGTTAPQAAGLIHTDFERGFIRAEVVSFEDFAACEGEHRAKETGKWRLEGKDYVVRDGDVISFRFNV